MAASSSESSSPVDELALALRRNARLQSAAALLSWDQETGMPPRGCAARAECCGELGRLTHESGTSKDLGALIDAANDWAMANADDATQRWVRVAKRDFDRQARIDPDLAEEYARAASETQQAWDGARKASDFAAFEPYLTRIVSIRKRMGEAYAEAGQSTYDALIQDYEPGASADQIAEVFGGVESDLVELARTLEEKSRSAPVDVLVRHYSRNSQAAFGRRIATDLGFDMTRGEIAESTHPFCMGLASPDDVRITTRYDEHDLRTALFGLIHETGHALYEQGLDGDGWGTSRCAANSMALHESQSRLWENFIGRSPEFWEHYYEPLKQQYPGALADVTRDAFVRAIHRVEATPIRVEADEVTYNLHILLRFDLERRLFNGEIDARDLRDAWNSRTEEVLGFTPESDALGVLQDIHWSFGAFGYFPTYFLGNLYAAQFYDAAKRDLTDLDDQVRSGEFEALLSWLRKGIHSLGSSYSAEEVCERVTGQKLDGRYLVDFLREKFERVHG